MTTAADPRIYPMPRKGRGASEATLDTASLPIPRTRIFPFYTGAIASRRRTHVLGRIVGPAIIKEIVYSINPRVDPVPYSIEIGKKRDGLQVDQELLTTPRTYEVLTELSDPFGNIADSAGQGLVPGTFQVNEVERHALLDLIVPDPEFFPVIGIVNGHIATVLIQGHLRVIEGLNREALANFL